MLNRFDDDPIHQTPEPAAQPATGDRNFYDRYFFNGYDRDGELADLNPLDPRHLHVHQLCRARCGSQRGVGVLEQLVIGRHEPSEFATLFEARG